MKAFLISQKPDRLNAVYPDEIRKKLAALTELDDTVLCRETLEQEPAIALDAEVLFSTWGMPTLTEAEIETFFPRLKAVFYAAGTVRKFARPFLNRGVRVFSAWAANAVPVSEFTVSEILLANKGFFTGSALMKRKKTLEAAEAANRYPGNYDAVVGLIGVGMIGSMVAERLKNHRVRVLGFDPFLSDEKAAALSVEKVSLPELFSSSDVVSNHLANNEKTRGMLDGKLFAAMKPYATFINTGRGAEVVEEDLVRVLRARPDLTALLDVTDPEPPEKDHPFYALPNVVLTPHIAGSLGREVVRMAETEISELKRYLSGTPSLYEVTEKMLETMA